MKHFLICIICLLFSHLLLAQKTKGKVYIDKFESASMNSLQKSSWSSYNDHHLGGKSSIQVSYKKEGEHKSQFLNLKYQLEKADWTYEPFAGISCAVTANDIPKGVAYLVYNFKGSAHRFFYQTNAVKDFAYYQRSIPASKNWTTVSIPLNSLRQPDWGRAVPFKADDLKGISWQVHGQDKNSGEVSIDNVRVVYGKQAGPLVKEEVVTIGTVKAIYSKELQEAREFYVYLPKEEEQIKASDRRYPVVYLLDGEWNFKALSAMVNQLKGVKFPEMIIIGIANTDRMRDYTPTPYSASGFSDMKASGFTNAGGAEAYLSFLEEELIPHVDSLYPTTPYRMLIGHSLGGLLVTETIVHHRHLFNGYLSIDPSLWWDGQKLLKQSQDLLHQNSMQGKRLYVAIANTFRQGLDSTTAISDQTESSIHFRAICRFEDNLREHTDSKLHYKFKYYDDETHGSLPLIAEYHGLSYLFNTEDFPFNKELNQKGFAAEAAFKAYYDSVSLQMGYTIRPSQATTTRYVNACLADNNYETAQALCRMNTHYYPTSEAFELLGDCFSFTGEKQKAIEAFEKSLSLKYSAAVKSKLDKME